MSDQFNDGFFAGGGEAVASAKFTNDSGPGGRTQVDGTVVGIVISTAQMDQTDFDSGEKIPDGKGGVKQQLQVILQTDYRNWDKASKPLVGEDNAPVADDGKRAIYVKGWMIGAIGDAIRAAQAPGLRPGGKLAVKVTELVTPRSGQGNPFAKYVAKYAPPAPGDTMFEQVQQPSAAPDFAQPAQQPVAVQPQQVQQPVAVPQQQVQQAPPAQVVPAAQPMPAPAAPQPQADPFGDPPF